MTRYIVKAMIVYEFESDTDQEAIDFIEHGYLDESHETDGELIELAKMNNDDEYEIIKGY